MNDDSPGVWAETRDRFPRDQKLRKHGCKIEHRPKGKAAVWSHPVHGTRTQSEMERLIFPGPA